MAQFFNRQEAEQAAESFKTQFPQLRVWNVLDLHNQEANDHPYQYSFFTVDFNQTAPSFHIASQEQVQNFLALCQYIAQTIADNRQSEEEDGKENVKGEHFCGQCGQIFQWSAEDISWQYEHHFLPCGHSWDMFDKF